MGILRFHRPVHNSLQLAVILHAGIFYAMILFGKKPPDMLLHYIYMTWPQFLMAIAGVGILGALFLFIKLFIGRLLLSICSFFFLGSLLTSVFETPSRAFIYIMLVAIFLGFLWQDGFRLPWRTKILLRRNFEHSLAIFSSLLSLLLYYLYSHYQQDRLFIPPLLAIAAAIVSILCWVYWVTQAAERRRLWFGILIVIIAAMSVNAALSETWLRTLALHSIIFPLISILSILWEKREIREGAANWVESLFFKPELSVLVTFLLLSLGGSLLLNLPISLNSPKSYIDSLFLAVSSSCITGLSVANLGEDYTFIGQTIVLVLIQLGGLGIMSLSSVALLLIGSRLSVRQEMAVHSMSGRSMRGAVVGTLRNVLLVTFVTELVAAVVLSSQFYFQGQSLGPAIWNGVFLAISAFCNAGLALQGDSLISFQSSPGVLLTLSTVIIVGGLSPAFVLVIPKLWRGQQIPLEQKMIFAATLLLLVSGTLLIAALEWQGALHELSFGQKVLNAWFQSVTSRTAGFNSVEFSQLGIATAAVIMLLMFIGGAPGGTAGGIKVTTFMILLSTIVSTVRGYRDVRIFRRRLPSRTIYLGTTVASIGVVLVFIFYVAVVLTQDIQPVPALFEVISALATTGLSMGATSALDDIGKLIITIAMFLGRIGPLTVIVLLAKHDKGDAWLMPEEDVTVT